MICYFGCNILFLAFVCWLAKLICLAGKLEVINLIFGYVMNPRMRCTYYDALAVHHQNKRACSSYVGTC